MAKTGVWLIGARGSVAAVTIAGQAAMRRGLATRAGLVTERPEFASIGLAPIDDFVFGGHEIRPGCLSDVVKGVLSRCGVRDLANEIEEDLVAADKQIAPGIFRGSSGPVGGLILDKPSFHTDAEAVFVVRNDLDAFKAKYRLPRLIVINVASTEPIAEPHPSWARLEDLEAAFRNTASVLPISALYAYAALLGGDAYINFTPSLGSRLPALEQLAQMRGALHMGSDGKTGETLLKSVLADLFVQRNLQILSWFSQNILGNDDGHNLSNPANKASKISCKDQLLSKILGYVPETVVGIDFVSSLGEWKLAWDHIHFEGFLGGRMSLQFIWSACDSLLAAPLVLDLVRLCDLAQRRGEKGVLASLAAFFKDPMGTSDQRLISQDESLLRWIRGT